MDLYRIAQKLNQYCTQETIDLQSVFAQFIKIIKTAAKRGGSWFVRENPQMLTREIYEREISDVI